MKVFRDIAEIANAAPAAVTVGTFDGFHRGHQRILEKIEAVSAADQLLKTVVTFEPHPRKIVGKPGTTVNILTTLTEKLDIFESAGIDTVLVIPFTRAFAAMSSEDFVKTILVDRLGVREMVVGYDHHFGKNREGSFELLGGLGEQHGFRVHQVPPFRIDEVAASSSLIRRFIESGEVDRAAHFLGRHYRLHALVVEGNKRGREIGYPTANLKVDHPDKLIPANGVYAVDVKVSGEIFRGMMNIGYRPTFDIDRLTLEVHLFNFDAWLYGHTIEVRFKAYIRPEKQFSGIDELRAQLDLDKKQCENI